MSQDPLDRIEGKLDKLDERQDRMELTLQHQTDQLGEHMRRTDLLETEQEAIRADMKPLTNAVVAWAVAGKVISVAGVLVAVAAGVVKLLLAFHILR